MRDRLERRRVLLCLRRRDGKRGGTGDDRRRHLEFVHDVTPFSKDHLGSGGVTGQPLAYSRSGELIERLLFFSL